MSFSDTFLYYPFIDIPESTLVHSLLFQERVRRIIPSIMGMDEQRYNDAQRPNAIFRQYLGYDFIEDANFWEATREVSNMFCVFLNDASTAKRSTKFEPLLGKSYKQRFDFRKNRTYSSTQHFIYAQKFDSQVFELLTKLNWTRFHSDMYACELSNELCNLYMTLLACCMSKNSGRPISTDVGQAASMIREPVFKKYFAAALPIDASDVSLQELCISILMRSDIGETDGKQIPMHQVLTIHEAARIRAGLEAERRSFSNCVGQLIQKAKISNPTSIPEFLKIHAQEVIEAAKDYNVRTKAAAADAMEKERRKLIPNLSTGISIAIPMVKLAIESSLNAKFPGMGAVASTGIEIAGLYLISNILPERQLPAQLGRTKSDEIHLFMNRLWDARDQRSSV